MTEEEFNIWLRDDTNHRVVLAEIEYHDGASIKTLYIASSPYITEPTDTPANTPYAGVITEVANIQSSIQDSASLGSLTIVNLSTFGNFNEQYEFDNILNYFFEGQKITILLGDKSWPRTDFVEQFIGTVDSLEMSDNTSITFNIRDNSDLLSLSIHNEDNNDFYTGNEEVLGLENIPKPICLGTVFNITPTLIEYIVAEKYQVHYGGPIMSILDVRENGRSLDPATDYTVDVNNGTFTLTNRSSGLITADVEGGYSNSFNFSKAVDIVKWIALKVGLSDSDINGGNEPGGLAYFNSSCGYITGIYITAIITAEEAISDFLSGLGAYMVFGSDGKLNIFRLEPPGLSVGEIQEDDVVSNSLILIETQSSNRTTRIGYRYNYTIQSEDSLAAELNAEEMQRFTEPYSIKVFHTTDPIHMEKFPLAKDTGVIQTYIYGNECAQTEATRRQLLRNTKRSIYKLLVYSPNCPLGLGTTVTIKHPRYDMNLGRNCVIVAKDVDILNRTTELEVFF